MSDIGHRKAPSSMTGLFSGLRAEQDKCNTLDALSSPCAVHPTPEAATRSIEVVSMVRNAYIAMKNAERAKLQEDVDQFLRGDGKVEVLGNTPFRRPEMLTIREASVASASRRFASGQG